MKAQSQVIWKMLGPRTAWRVLDPLTGEVLEEGPVIAEVLCDLCNAEVTIRPVPVAWGSHALCPTCFQQVFHQDVVTAGVRDRIHIAVLAPGTTVLVDTGTRQEQWVIEKPLWKAQIREGSATRIPILVRRPRGSRRHILVAHFHDEFGFMGWGKPTPIPQSPKPDREGKP